MSDWFIFLFLIFFLSGCSSPMINSVPNPALTSELCAVAGNITSPPQSTPTLDCGLCLRECSKVLDESVVFYSKMQGIGTMIALREGEK